MGKSLFRINVVAFFTLCETIILLTTGCSRTSPSANTGHTESVPTGLSAEEQLYVEQRQNADGQASVNIVAFNSGGLKTKTIPISHLRETQAELLNTGYSVALDLPVELSEVADESLLFSAKESFGLSAWQTAHPNADGRGVTIAVVDDGIALARPGLITTSTGAQKISRSINMGPLWQFPLRDAYPEGCTPNAVVSRPRSDAWTFAAELNLTPAAITKRFSFDVSPCGINPELQFQPQECARWMNQLLSQHPTGQPRPSEIAAVYAETTNGAYIFADFNGNGQISVDEALRPISSTDVGPKHYLLRDGRAFGFDVHSAEHFVSPHLGHDYAPLECLDRAPAPAKVLTMAPPASANDFGSHGEGVASVSAGYRIAGRPFDGVAPGAQLVDVAFGDPFSGRLYNISTIAQALLAGGRNADIVNLSYSVFFNSPASQVAMSRLLEETLSRTNAIYMFSAGNNGPGRGSMNRALMYPSFGVAVGAYLDPAASQTVFGSSVPVGGVVSYSSRGPGPDGFSGPFIISPLAGMAASTADEGFRPFSGTSSATPAAAGFVARVLSALREESVAFDRNVMRLALMNGAVPLPDVAFIDQGFGLPQLTRVWAAYKAAVAPSTSTPSLPLDIRLASNSETGVARRGIFVRGTRDRSEIYRVNILPLGGASSATYAESLRLSSGPTHSRTAQQWLNHSPALLLPATGSSIEVSVNWALLNEMGPGEYTTQITLTNADSGAIRGVIPVTVIVPHKDLGVNTRELDVSVDAGGLTRVFLERPYWATALALKMETADPAQGLCVLAKIYNPTGVRLTATSAFGSTRAQHSFGSQAMQPGVYEVTLEGRSNHTSCAAGQNLRLAAQWIGLETQPPILTGRRLNYWLNIGLTTGAPVVSGKVRFSDPVRIQNVELYAEASSSGYVWKTKEPLNLSRYASVQLSLTPEYARALGQMYNYSAFSALVYSRNVAVATEALDSVPIIPLVVDPVTTDPTATGAAAVAPRATMPTELYLPADGSPSQGLRTAPRGAFDATTIIVSTFDTSTVLERDMPATLPIRIIAGVDDGYQTYEEQQPAYVTLRSGATSSVLVPMFELGMHPGERIVLNCEFTPVGFDVNFPCGEVDAR